MIEEMLRNGFGIMAYMHEGDFIIGFIDADGLLATHQEKDAKTDQPIYTSVTSRLVPKAPVDSDSLTVALDYVSKLACNLMYGTAESERD